MKLKNRAVEKDDLLFKDYQWTHYSEDHPNISGWPDHTAFDRREGEQMLYMINQIIAIHELSPDNDAKMIEMLIRGKMPESFRSQRRVVSWVAGNWKMAWFKR
ncbi:hypothetical protein [Aliikangiella sp. G2MR2-5]|uniref:hypothetical protein n=1 Tax=Aliikangiella sp. G2MR2-5 TaxID=2788943 RepID=UPI0018A94C3C|nr:hypothetical protein [Aliikangiella sp. G2MR2-5]